jgi:Cu+-exporting ATPase
MERDVVCGMEVEKDTAAAQSEYEGRTYYFCSTACKEAFDQSPEQYLQKEVA